MKKLMLGLSLFIISGCFTFAEDDFVLSTITQLNLNDKAILDRIDAYNKLKMDSFLPALLNGVIGFGSGSFAQNDTLFGILGFSGDLIGIGMVSIGFTLLTTSFIDFNTNVPIVSTGLGVFVISKFMQLWRVGTYSYDYNKNLWNSLIK